MRSGVEMLWDGSHTAAIEGDGVEDCVCAALAARFFLVHHAAVVRLRKAMNGVSGRMLDIVCSHVQPSIDGVRKQPTAV